MSKELRLVRRSPCARPSRIRFRPIQEPELKVFSTDVQLDYEGSEQIPQSDYAPPDKLPQIYTPEPKSIHKRLVGINARLAFTQQFRGLKRTVDVNRFYQRENSPVEAYLSRIDRSLLLPEPMGLVKTKGKDCDLNISRYSMGDSFAEALSESFTTLEMERVNLRSNRLTDAGARKVINNLKANVLLELDLSYNYIGLSTIAKLGQMLQSHNTALRVLKLESLRLSDATITVITRGLVYCEMLQELVLARNMIGEAGAASLSGFVKNASSLQKLDLHWNQIRGEGARKLVKALGDAEALRVLDLSWNSLASPSLLNCASPLSKLFVKHQSLSHVDLSHNLFSATDCAKIQQGLASNHTIMGLHLEGNDAKVDSQGVVGRRDGIDTGSGHIFVRLLGNSKLREAAAWRQISNCWICERWSEVEFIWEPGVSGLGDRDPIYLHLDIDEWRPDLMVKDTEGIFRVVRMCPPGAIRYFFTHDGKVRLALDKLKKKLSTTLNFSFIFYGTEPVPIKVTEVNLLHNTPTSTLQDHNQIVIPRPLPKIYVPTLKKRDWKYENSLFRDYRIDTDELLDKCFEYDWSCTRLPRIVKDPEDLRIVKDLLKAQYKWM